MILDTSEIQAKPIILIIGTDAETRLLYRLFLELWNFKIVEADCFDETLTILQYVQPELILMDGNFSFEENLETIQQIRSNMLLQTTPLVLTSGHSQSRMRDLALKSGADDYLVKPLNFDELKNNLRRNIENVGRNLIQGGIA